MFSGIEKINTGVSVVICCHNSIKRLPDTLDHLARQEVNTNLSWEVIVVDNNSHDDTSAIAQQIWDAKKTDIPFHVVIETNLGLSYARKKGVITANYEYVIFCDDDNWLASDYIQKSFDIINDKPNYAAIGGLCEAVFDKDTIVPDWFNKHKSDYAIGKQSEQSGDITKRGLVWGAGIVIKKSIFLRVYKYPALLSDRKGVKLDSGGDNEMCLRFILFGYKLYYDEQLQFKHFIPKNRLEDSYHKSLRAAFIEAAVIVDFYKDFLRLYAGKKNKMLNAAKWEIKYWLFRLKVLKIDPKSMIFPKMVTLFTPHFKRQFNELNEIKKIYRQSRQK